MQIPKAYNWEHLSNKLSLLKMLLEPRKPTDFRPAVNTFKIKISLPALPLFARCQFSSQESFCLSREGTWGQERGSLSPRAAPAVPFPLHLAACR